jgi:hypothetical protein
VGTIAGANAFLTIIIWLTILPASIKPSILSSCQYDAEIVHDPDAGKTTLQVAVPLTRGISSQLWVISRLKTKVTIPCAMGPPYKVITLAVM